MRLAITLGQVSPVPVGYHLPESLKCADHLFAALKPNTSCSWWDQGWWPESEESETEEGQSWTDSLCGVLGDALPVLSTHC